MLDRLAALFKKKRVDVVQHAREVWNEGDPGTAAALLDAYLAKNPTDDPALFLRGSVHHSQNENDQAYRMYERALAKLTRDEQLASGWLHRLAFFKGKITGEWLDEIPEYERIVQVYPEFSDGHFNLGRLYDECGDAARALEQYEHVRRLNPRDDMLPNNLGNTLLQALRPEDACAVYERGGDPLGSARALACAGREREANELLSSEGQACAVMECTVHGERLRFVFGGADSRMSLLSALAGDLLQGIAASPKPLDDGQMVKLGHLSLRIRKGDGVFFVCEGDIQRHKPDLCWTPFVHYTLNATAEGLALANLAGVQLREMPAASTVRVETRLDAPVLLSRGEDQWSLFTNKQSEEAFPVISVCRAYPEAGAAFQMLPPGHSAELASGRVARVFNADGAVIYIAS